MKNSRNVLYLALAAFVIATLFIYNSLGGFDSLTYELSEEENYFIGEPFQGNPKAAKLEKLFKHAREVSTAQDGYDLAIVNYQSEEESLDQVIGVITDSIVTDFKDGQLSVSKTFSGKFISTTISAHSLVMPSPTKVLRGAKKFAEKNGLTVDESYTIEIYKAERDLRVLFPLID